MRSKLAETPGGRRHQEDASEDDSGCLCVFAVVNVSVLVLRRDRVEHKHVRTPTAPPVLGAVTSLILAGPLSDRPAHVHIRAGGLLAVGIGLWVLNRTVMKARGEA